MSSTTPHHDADPPSQKMSPETKKVSFSPRQLNIVWGKDSRYWKLPSPGSSEAAELLQVCWLEVSGCVNIDARSTVSRYRISFKLSLKSDAFGWNNCPVYVMAKFGKKGKYVWKKISLQGCGPEPAVSAAEGLEIEAKEISDANNTIYFGLYEVWSGKWKGGLQLHNAEVTQLV